jgi:hypothetical protein
MEPLSIEILVNRTPENVCIELLAAKRAEAAANAARVRLEEELTALVDARAIDDEGSKTYTLDGFKVEVKRALSRKPVDAAAFKALQALKGVPAELMPIKTKVEFDQTGAKYLSANEPKIWAKMSALIVTSPSKVAVTVTRVD